MKQPDFPPEDKNCWGIIKTLETVKIHRVKLQIPGVPKACMSMSQAKAMLDFCNVDAIDSLNLYDKFCMNNGDLFKF